MEDFITEVDILDEAKSNFLTYTSEVLTDRAIPAAEDGLLSSQRKILWTMEDFLKMDSKGKTKKSNAIVGSTLATSYFHGDQACYGVLCKMSQKFLMRYPLIEGQGSLGTQEDNAMVASSRYTEAKPSKYADLMMQDFNKGPVPLKETYNGEFMEPVILPGLFPNAICNGRQAIGISMAHNSLPHNLTEVCNGIVAYINNNDITINEVMEHIKGPDFPLENVIINQKDIKTAFATGKSAVSLKVRGCYKIEGNKIIFYTIPYRTYRNKIKEQIAKNADALEKFFDDYNDESALGENRLVFEVKAGISPLVAVEKLFACTDLQTTVSYNMNYIINGTPKLCSIIDLIKAYYIHQTNVLIKVAEYDKAKAEKRKHILEGHIKIIDDLDNAIALIKNSNNKAEAKEKLIKKYDLDETQALAVLDMKLSTLTKLDRADIYDELKIKVDIIKEKDRIIQEKDYRDSILIHKIEEMKKNYGDERRTHLENITITKSKEEKEIVNVAPEDCVVTMTANDVIKRMPTSAFKVQKRGSKGVKTKEDIIINSIHTNTIDNLLVFTDAGLVYRLLVDDIPSGVKGTNIRSLIGIGAGEKVAAIYSLQRENSNQFLLYITKNGMVKKTFLSEYSKLSKKTGTIAIKVREDDAIVGAALLNEEEIIITTKQGMCIRFDSKSIGATGRNTIGVKGISLKAEDEVVSLEVIRDKRDDLAVFSADGLGKRIKLTDITSQGRAGKGNSIYKGAEVVATAMVNNDDNILISGITNSVCISAKDMPVLGTVAKGNIVLKGTRLQGVTKV